MPDTQQLLVFLAAGLLLNLTPGPDVLYVLGSALRDGAKAGAIAACGITAGCFVHVAGAALGVGALLAASATAFAVLKWAGAAYLVWVGVRLLRAQPGAGRWDAPGGAAHPAGRPASAWHLFRGAFLTNVLNPKVAIFFLAFVPQFIAPHAAHPALVFLALGILFNIDSLAVNCGWALAAAWMARREAVRRGMHWLDRTAGLMFVAFGLKLALAGRPTH